ncbi:hypothetical protein BV898_02200 [Hypsibius exemplaris]|uniref:Uncharacterized protein n=1 Tax=Hypsibius exemplaris TaxID=2072580 RepID=A0A1W0X9A5_HYPEX|nr:hypothetical protein BV898_02200 [Hypsibius exemplaris]
MPVAMSPLAESFRSDISPPTPGSVHSGHHHAMFHHSPHPQQQQLQHQAQFQPQQNRHLTTNGHGPPPEEMGQPQRFFSVSPPGPRFVPMRWRPGRLWSSLTFPVPLLDFVFIKLV